jgi:hypothetical protein
MEKNESAAEKPPRPPACLGNQRLAAAPAGTSLQQATLYGESAAIRTRQGVATRRRCAVNIQTFARIYGIVFLIVGICGFIPGVTPPHHHPGLAVQAGSGMELGLFPVNALHNLVHILFGAWGLLAARTAGGARTYARVVAIAYALLTILGLIPATNTTFGLVPIYGHDVWLHAALAIVAGYFGFAYRAAVTSPAA